MTVAGSFAVPAVHPALAGHFPDCPLVPGSMILELVMAAWDGPCLGVLAARFHAPLSADRPVEVRFALSRDPGTVRFDCRCGGREVCSGRLLVATAP